MSLDAPSTPPVAAPPAWARRAPGLAQLLAYRRADLLPDLLAGLAVAAVAVPVGIAYSELAGLPVETGLYGSLVPLLIYAVLGSSRQLILGPDAATCTLIAASVAPLAAGDAHAYASIAAVLAILAGLMCLAASALKLGALADFLSKPILVGFLNGIAIHIMLGQLGKILGLDLRADGLFATLAEAARRLHETHWPTLALALAAFGTFKLSARLWPRVPAAIVTMAVSGALVAAFALDAHGVKTLGAVPAGLPGLFIPEVPLAVLPQLAADAAGLALVSFTGLMLASRAFASKNGYEVDADQDLAALGLANVAVALNQGFAISGADSRTAMGDAAGGRTNATGLFAALAVAIVLLAFTWPLRFVPAAALGAVLVFAALSLVDLKTLLLIWQADRTEAIISLIATAGVVAFGAMEGIAIAVLLAVLRFVHLSARPRVELLGRVPGMPGFHALDRHSGAAAPTGLLALRFNGPLVFFNSGHFRHEVLAAADRARGDVHAVVLDLLPVTEVDVTGLFTVREVRDLLAARGIALVGAGRRTEWLGWFAAHGFNEDVFPIFPTLHEAVRTLSDAPLPPSALSPEAPAPGLILRNEAQGVLRHTDEGPSRDRSPS